MELQHFELEVTNELPLEFEGEQLFFDSNIWVSGQDRSRYHDLEIYRAIDQENDYYIVWISFKTRWQGENTISEFFTVDDRNQIKTILEEYDPIAHLVGFPSHDRYEEKQNVLKKNLTFEWRSLKAKALQELGFKREVGRPTKGDYPRVSTTVTIDPKLKKLASDHEVNLSALLNDTLSDLVNEKGWI